MAQKMYQCLQGYVDILEIHIILAGSRRRWTGYIK